MTALLAAALWCVATAPPVPTPTAERIVLTTMTPAQAVEVYERVLEPGQGATLTPAGDDAIVVRDTPERVNRFRSLVAFLDLPGAKERRIYVRPVRHRPASELVEVTRRIFGDTLGKDVGLAPDDRSSQLVVHARPVQYTEIDRLLRRLDIRPRDERRIFVLPGRTPLPAPVKRP